MIPSELIYDFLIVLGKRLTEVDVSTVLTLLQCKWNISLVYIVVKTLWLLIPINLLYLELLSMMTPHSNEIYMTLFSGWYQELEPDHFVLLFYTIMISFFSTHFSYYYVITLFIVVLYSLPPPPPCISIVHYLLGTRPGERYLTYLGKKTWRRKFIT